MKKTLFYLFLMMAAVTSSSAEESTAHPPYFEDLFSKTTVKTLLEFGMGSSTQYLLDSCNKVISMEFITHGYGPDRFRQCVSLYADYYNWIPIAFFSGYHGDMSWAPYKYQGSDHAYKAISYQTSTLKNYAEIDDFYVAELNAFVASLTKCHRIDAAYINGAIFIRGDIVQALFDKTPIILAESTYGRERGELNDVYGYSRVITPKNYEEIFIPVGSGTTAWVLKDDRFKALATAFKKYAMKAP